MSDEIYRHDDKRVGPASRKMPPDFLGKVRVIAEDLTRYGYNPKHYILTASAEELLQSHAGFEALNGTGRLFGFEVQVDTRLPLGTAVIRSMDSMGPTYEVSWEGVKVEVNPGYSREDHTLSQIVKQHISQPLLSKEDMKKITEGHPHKPASLAARQVEQNQQMTIKAKAMLEALETLHDLAPMSIIRKWLDMKIRDLKRELQHRTQNPTSPFPAKLFQTQDVERIANMKSQITKNVADAFSVPAETLMNRNEVAIRMDAEMAITQSPDLRVFVDPGPSSLSFKDIQQANAELNAARHRTVAERNMDYRRRSL